MNGNNTTGQIFDTSGDTGTFTAVVDTTVTDSVTSVTDSAGNARFNFTPGATYFVNQIISLSTFVESTYNGTFIITAAGAGFFETGVAFVAGDTGTVDADAISIDDTGTILNDGDTITLDTDLATDYDGGATVFNQQVNTFEVSRVYNPSGNDPQTGTWSQAGLNQKDARIAAVAQTDNQDSKFIATAFVNNNVTVNPTITNNTFINMAFGTGGAGLISGSNIELWKLIDPVIGVFEYLGNEPFDGSLTFDFTVISSGGTVDFRFKWLIDIGAGFVDLPDPVEALVAVGSSSQSASKTFPLAVVKGDQIKPQITRNSGSSTIITSYATIYATQ